MKSDWRPVWCRHPWCNAVAFGVFSAEDEARMQLDHAPKCDGLRRDRDVATAEQRMRADGRWQRVARRWTAKGVSLPPEK